MKTIAMRGRKELLAVFNKYAKLSGKQNQARPAAVADFVKSIATLPLDSETVQLLRAASKVPIDVGDIEESAVPASIKIIIDVTDTEWDRAMEVFRYAFSLKNNPQMPYFIRVAGIAAIQALTKENAELGIAEAAGADSMAIEKYRALSMDEKLNRIYELLLKLERRNCGWCQ